MENKYGEIVNRRSKNNNTDIKFKNKFVTNEIVIGKEYSMLIIKDALRKKDFVYIIDTKNISLVSKYDWRYNNGYACAAIHTYLPLHNLIMGTPENGYVVDHINRNKYDNREDNLRIIKTKQNHYNKDTKGYRYDTKRKYYQAYIHIDDKFINLGTYKTEEEAIAARKAVNQYLFPNIRYYEEDV